MTIFIGRRITFLSLGFDGFLYELQQLPSGWNKCITVDRLKWLL